ncbi:MAG: hypothetical protein WA994_05590 [Ornithinimicrobium sp.]
MAHLREHTDYAIDTLREARMVKLKDPQSPRGMLFGTDWPIYTSRSVSTATHHTRQ